MRGPAPALFPAVPWHGDKEQPFKEPLLPKTPSEGTIRLQSVGAFAANTAIACGSSVQGQQKHVAHFPFGHRGRRHSPGTSLIPLSFFRPCAHPRHPCPSARQPQCRPQVGMLRGSPVQVSG